MKQLSTRKLIAFSIILAMTFASLTGCKSKTNEGNENNNSQNNSTPTPEVQEPEKNIVPGEYTASEKGYGGNVTAIVTVAEDGTIKKIDIKADAETSDIGGKIAPIIADTIVANQSLAVDAVSGATVTSNAVIAAVSTALSQAGVDVEALKNKEVSKIGVDEEITIDIVIAGAGGSGTAAALAAAEKGMKVLIIEKTASAGGNSKLASGLFAVDSKLQKDAGLDLSVEHAVNAIMEFNQYLSNGPIVRSIIGKSANTIEWLEGYGVEFKLPEKTTQYAHEDDPYKWKTNHMFVDQTAAFTNMYEHLDSMGVKVRYNTSLLSILRNNEGIVTGITAVKEDGGILTVNAAATIIATGGFGGDTEKTSAILKTNLFNSLGLPNYGEGLNTIEAIGGYTLDATPLLHGCQFANSDVMQNSSVENQAEHSDSSLTQILNTPLLWVDRTGSRFTNEDVVYDSAFWANAAYSVGGQYYIIVDKATLEAFTTGSKLLVSQAGLGAKMEPDDFIGLANAAVDAGNAYRSNSIVGLAEALQMRPEELAATVGQYNEIVKNKVDTEYGKDKASLEYTIESGDFYAFDVRGVFWGTIGGVKVDEHMQVMDMDYQFIPGLYAAGSTAGGYYTGLGYPPYEGLASGFAFTSGRIAGLNAIDYVTSK